MAQDIYVIDDDESSIPILKNYLEMIKSSNLLE